MSIECLNQALKVKGLKPTEKLILVILANYADEHGSCYPSQQHIANIIELNDLKHIRKILHRFQDMGLLKIEQRFQINGGNTSNRYHLSLGGGLQTPLGAFTRTPRVATPPNTKEEPKENNNYAAKAKEAQKNCFEEFWKLYPRKVGKHQAKVKYNKEIKSCSPEVMRVLVKRFAEETKFNKTEDQFIPHCATWLNQRRYLDYTSNDYKKRMKKTTLNAIAG